MTVADIVIRGAREHNLQDINLTLPRNQLIVMTGVSGSGKSSLAFDTLYAEGQRRYVESLSSYARQFLGQMPKPDVDSITGLAPSISIQQKASGRNPRSTVGTITEIYDYLRVLFARVGTPTCYQCGRAITAQTREHILDRVLRLPDGTKYSVLAPLVQRQKGEFKDLFVDLLKRGFLRARVDGKLIQLTDELQLDKQMKHTIDVVVDRLVAGKTPRAHVAEAIETALNLAERKLVIAREAQAVDGQELDSLEPVSDILGTSANRKRASRAAVVPEKNVSAKIRSKTAQQDLHPPGERDTDERVAIAGASTQDELYSCDYACTHCGISYDQPSPQLFSFNSPQGMCQDCQGLGIRFDFATDRLVPDDSLTIQKGAIVVLGKLSSVGKWRKHILKGVARAIELDLGLAEDSFFKTKWRDLPTEAKRLFLYGLGSRNITFAYRSGHSVWKRGGTYAGFIPELLDEYRKTRNPMRRVQLEKYMHETGCASCAGRRLNQQACSYRISSKSGKVARDERRGASVKSAAANSTGLKKSLTNDSGNGKAEEDPLTQTFSPQGRGEGTREDASSLLSLSLPEVCSLSTLAAWEFFGELELSDAGQYIASEALKEIRGRLGFLLRCGLDYLTLDRTAPTLSGGESQRIRLAGQIGCGLVGVVYILDEPSIGLHPRDNVMLLDSLKDLRDQGNTVIVVEHDDETMKAADHIVDFGPGPGVRGGEVVVEGTVDDVKKSKRSLTGAFLSGRRSIEVPKVRRPGNGHAIEIHGATHHNLQNVTVHFPLGQFICVTGVSGSGKSSLVNDILWEVLNRDVNKGTGRPGQYEKIVGLEHIDKAIDIDQSPIGRTPRSNPATYVKLFDLIRDLYTTLPESKMRGFKPGRFSFNVPSGRCEACEGNGANKLEMDFLADIWVTCPVCQGKRFNKETLDVRFKGKNINDVLDMDIQQALEHFENHPKLMKSLQTLHDVGMDYIKLGQPSPTLSGGEAQRVKLAKELSKRSTGKTVYILDEPTTGLHFVDIEHLLRVLHGFVEAGNTVIVVEHNLDVIKTADWVIDLGPEGGSGGGRVLFEGTPEEILLCGESYTGHALRMIPGLNPSTNGTRKKKGTKGKTTSPSPVTLAHSVSRWQTSVALKDSAHGADTSIVVRGASQHNLQHLDLTIPRDQMSVFCGPSGSGKSSLAMDTLYAEGQRRYVESLSSYARQFLGQMPKPRVEHIHGLQPSIAIEQKTVGNTPRSTVGTVTEIYDYLRILFARLGTQYCPDCNIPVQSQTVDDVIDRLMQMSEKPNDSASQKRTDVDSPSTRLLILAPQDVTVGQHYSKLWERLDEQGFRRVRIDGVTYTLDEVPEIDRKRKHNVEIVVDRVTLSRTSRSRLAESVELAFDLGKGFIRAAIVDEARDEKKWKVLPFSLFRACEQCGRSFEELAPHNFSFNSPLGWCDSCEGIGIQQGTNLGALISDQTRSLSQGAVSAWPDPIKSPLFRRMLAAMARECDIPLDVPFSQMDPIHQRAVLYGTGDIWITLVPDENNAASAKKAKSKSATASVAAQGTFRFQYKGLYPAIEQAASLSYDYRIKLYGLVGEVPCTSCNGSRLREDASAVRLAGKTLKQLCDLPLREALSFLSDLKLNASQKKIAGDLLGEATSRLRFLVDVGLHYLTLGRTLPTLSGGETQRIRLAGQIGRALTGVLYVLDEPTIGLHPSDNGRLLSALIKLRDLGNTIIMVEHDREVLQAADRLYDFGPGAGRFGGTITAQGTPREIKKSELSLTGKFLSGREEILIPAERRMQRVSANPSAKEKKSGLKSEVPERLFVKVAGIGTVSVAHPARMRSVEGLQAEYDTPPGGGWLELLGARQHNLRNVDLKIPLGTLTAVTGVSGSGKSSLIDDTLARVIARNLHRASTQPGPHDELHGLQYLSKLIVVDQQPLGTTPASNPATYTGVFEHIRELFARMPDAKVRGYNATRFSFNRAGGRCEACEGNGQKLIEMHFLPDVWVECDVCRGQRYNAETLAVQYRGKSIADVLAMSIGQALELFDNIPKIRSPLSVLAAIGLDYLTLGQPAPTLSGGEAQRVKLAAELARPQTGKTLYLLDEPTTGLHFDDIRKLLKILNGLVDAGNTVVVIEHHLDVIKTADWIIDLGPHAGSEGGWIVAEGTPEDVAMSATSEGTGATEKTGENFAPRTSKSKNKEPAIDRENGASEIIVGSLPKRHRSLTGEVLAKVLKGGERGDRETFDAEEARRKQKGDLDPTKIGADAKMPWEVDGRRWHTVDGLANNGRPRRWNGEILGRIIDTIEASKQFGPTNWKERSTVEITAKTKSISWFLHVYTGDEWLLSLKFRVPKKTFVEETLATELALKDVNDLDNIPVYNRQPRVRIRPSANGPFEDVTVSILDLAETETPAFKRFFATARKSFVDRASPEALNLDDLTPWKKLGRKWHLMRKGFLQGTIEWEPAVLEELAALLDELLPSAAVDWTQKVVVNYLIEKSPVANLVTKRPAGLDFTMFVPGGSVQLGEVASFGVDPEIAPYKDGLDVVRLRFTKTEQVKAMGLRTFLMNRWKPIQP